MLILAFIFFGWAVVLMFFRGFTVPLGSVLYTASPGLVNGVQTAITRYIGSDLWYWIFVPILEQPAWIPPVTVGILLVIAHDIAKRRAW